MTNGIIFDIQRAGLYDGPGVRTVIFLKGCPLRCQWCHNPESQRREAQVSFRPEACLLCGECQAACEQHAHTVDGTQHRYHRDLCLRCGECIERCAFEALQLAGREATVAEIMAEVERDRVYYEQSGGGLTLTGGEPMSQLPFSLELLAAAKASGIHTCIETCGFASAPAYQKIMPVTDLFLFDYKATASDLHRQLTGVENDLILRNLKLLVEAGARLWLRCPMIPGVNDDVEHLRAIAALERTYPTIERIDILPYHNIGNDKYARYGMTNPLPVLPTTAEETKRRWRETLRSAGSQKAVVQ